MDAAEGMLPVDARPSAERWRAARSAIRRARTDEQRAQLRLYVVHMYTDDPIMAVVGVDRALRLLRLWARLTVELGLIMAIPEKRSLGTWAPWLGVLLLAGLGLVLVPKAKLLRTVHRIDELLTDGLPFQDYRSLIGLLFF
jgi:hypothetical protein